MANKKKLILQTLILANLTGMLTRTIYISLIVFTLSSCASSIFSNAKTQRRTPKNYGLQYSEIKINSKINSWFIPAVAQNRVAQNNSEVKAKATVIFFHSKNGSLENDFYQTLWLLKKGYNVLIPDYSNVEDIYSELDTIVNFVGKSENLGKIILWGQDVGASMVIYLAANSFNKNNICLAIAEGTIPNYSDYNSKGLEQSFILNPFSKIFSRASSSYSSNYDAENFIENVTPVSLLLIHGSKDQVVPAEEASKLYSRARKPKKLWAVKGASHLNTLYNQQNRQNELAQYLNSICSRPSF